MKPLYFVSLACLAVVVTADLQTFQNLLHDGNIKFTTNMFTEVAKGNPEKSFVISAFSVMTPLAQLGLAAVDQTHDELLDVIGMPDDDSTKEVFSFANTRVKSVKGVTLKTASKIYVAQDYDLNKEFADTTRDVFGSEVQNIDFDQKQSAAKEVNAWVEQQTNNRIKDLVNPDSLSEDTRALLVNAIYFKGSWLTKFNQRHTSQKDFHVNNEFTTKVDIMFMRGHFKYTDSDALKSQVIEIPYEGGETSLIVVLPRDIEGIKDLKEILKDPTVLDKTLSEMYVREVDLYLPKFKIETTTDLKEILEKMNVTKVFDPYQSRLDNLLNVKGVNVYISSATQKAFIEVNEEGAEAAASNSFVISITRRLPAPTPVFIANRPFYFVLKTNSLHLFTGVMYAK